MVAAMITMLAIDMNLERVINFLQYMNSTNVLNFNGANSNIFDIFNPLNIT